MNRRIYKSIYELDKWALFLKETFQEFKLIPDLIGEIIDYAVPLILWHCLENITISLCDYLKTDINSCIKKENPEQECFTLPIKAFKLTNLVKVNLNEEKIQSSADYYLPSTSKCKCFLFPETYIQNAQLLLNPFHISFDNEDLAQRILLSILTPSENFAYEILACTHSTNERVEECDATLIEFELLLKGLFLEDANKIHVLALISLFYIFSNQWWHRFGFLICETFKALKKDDFLFYLIDDLEIARNYFELEYIKEEIRGKNEKKKKRIEKQLQTIETIYFQHDGNVQNAILWRFNDEVLKLNLLISDIFTFDNLLIEGMEDKIPGLFRSILM